jgi:hypothetical protein
MKTLTLTQPWATLVAIGAKQIETRSWGTSYRGPLAIHAAKGFPRDARDFADCRFVNHFLVTAGYATADKNAGLPVGCVIATCRLVAVKPTIQIRATLTDQELAFGNYDNGRWGWILEDMKELSVPVPAKGALGLWNWEGA